MSRFKLKNSFILCTLALLVYFLAPKFALAKTLKFNDQTWDVFPTFGNFVSTPSITNNSDLLSTAKNSILGSPTLTTERLLSEDTLSQIQDIASKVDQQTKEVSLVINGNHATTFDPGQSGQTLDLYSIAKLLASDASEIDLPMAIFQPQTKLSETNNLGINELVSVGISDFKGSPKNRLVNIRVGADKYNGLIIAPGEEFSFNKYLGDVDEEHGFLPELVIKPEGVTPEFGGGLCQVSSTTFRAAMNAGLPITARRNHSFAVQYYAPQGTDATIYPGSADLKFVNNLPSSILVHTYIIGTKLYFEFYGTKDSRQIAFEGPVQYDKKTDGSMKATWTRHVTQNGSTTTQVFNSTYLPPAQFPHDSTEQAATPNPQAPPTPPVTPPTPTT
jgi:vancomycin resistance protein YoaR